MLQMFFICMFGCCYCLFPSLLTWESLDILMEEVLKEITVWFFGQYTASSSPWSSWALSLVIFTCTISSMPENVLLKSLQMKLIWRMTKTTKRLEQEEMQLVVRTQTVEVEIILKGLAGDGEGIEQKQLQRKKGLNCYQWIREETGQDQGHLELQVEMRLVM